jgi:hypothetical protein
LKVTDITSKLILSGILFLLTLLSGFWLSQAGKPYNTAIFTIHKLIALATVIIIGVTIRAFYQPLQANFGFELGLIPLIAFLFLALFVSGALLSIGKPDAAVVLRVHQAAPLLALLSSTLILYLLVSRSS